jgi:glucose/arabinose dehydrogenase
MPMLITHSKQSRWGLIGTIAALSATSPVAAQGQVEAVGPPAAARGWRAVTVVQGLPRPWGIAWLRDGRPIITNKRGTLQVLTNGRLQQIPIEGLPRVFTGGQGGLMDIALHPDYRRNSLIYMTMATGTESRNRTTLIRGTFDGKRVRGVQTLFRVSPDKSGGQHFGSRLQWLPDRTLLMSIGDGGNPPLRIGNRLAREQAQNLNSHLGSILRLTDSGRPAPNNPLLGRSGVRREIWSYGHRNIQGLTRDPRTGRVWASEHGPRGGDELNLIMRGGNYGWPLQTFGRDYRTGNSIGRTAVSGAIGPKTAWTPAHAPSGLAFYTGPHFPNWRGSLFSGGLASQDIRRIALDRNGNVTGQSRLFINRRIRDVKQGPDGYLYALTDEENGRLLRIEPGS